MHTPKQLDLQQALRTARPLLAATLALCAAMQAQAGVVSTIGNGGTAWSPFRIAVSSQHDVYIGDNGNGKVWKLAAGATTATLLATLPAASGTDVSGLVLDEAGGLLYAAGGGENTITRIQLSDGSSTPARDVAQLAGQTNTINGMAAAGPGALYLVDQFGKKVSHWPIPADFSTPGTFNPVLTELSVPVDVAADATGNLWVADLYANQLVAWTKATNTQAVVAGTGTVGYSGDGGPASAAQLNSPRGVARDSAGNLYITDSFNGFIRRIDGLGLITTVARADDLGVPNGIAVAGLNAIYFTDAYTLQLRKVSFNPPAAPQQLVASVDNAGKATLSWQAGTGGPAATSYTAAVAGDASKTCNATAPATTCTIVGLTAGTAYRFKVLAHNDALDDANDPNSANNSVSAVAATPMMALAPPSMPSLTLGAKPVTLHTTATLAGGNNPTGTITFTLVFNDTLVDTETVSVNGNSTYATPTGYTLPYTNAPGTYTWTVTYTGDDNNPSESTSSGSITASAATVTVTANNASMEQGDAFPPFTASYSGFVNGEGVADITPATMFTTTATSSSPPGMYAITASGASGGYYQFSYQPGTLTITRAMRTVSGTVNGLPAGASVQLQNNGGDTTTVSANGGFSFSTPVAQGDSYSVSVLTQPNAATCTVRQGTGTMGATSVSNVAVDCTANLTIQTSGLGSLQVGQAVSGVQLLATGGLAPYTWAATDSQQPLPAGLQLSSSGVLSGQPTAEGSYTTLVTVTDSSGAVTRAVVAKAAGGASASQVFTGTVAAAQSANSPTPVPLLGQWWEKLAMALLMLLAWRALAARKPWL